MTKRNAAALLECWSVSPFRWVKNRFECAYCGSAFLDCDLLRDHVAACPAGRGVDDIYRRCKVISRINIDVTGASCRVCSCLYDGVQHMASHVARHGFHFDAEYPDGVLPFRLDKEVWRCVLCQLTFSSFLNLYAHMNVHYQHHICDTCGKGFMTSFRLKKHSEAHSVGSFSCSACEKTFATPLARHNHKAKEHRKGPRYECPRCKVRFDSYYHRMNHLHDVHQEKKTSYSCSVCALSFKTSGKRSWHVKNVHFPAVYKFPCSLCEWKFRSGRELKRHMVRHSGDRQFHCPLCAKAFPRNQALKCHMKTHQPKL